MSTIRQVASELPPLQEGIMALVVTIRACMPQTVFVGVQAFPPQGWIAVVMQGGMELRRAMGRTPDVAVEMLYNALLDDARKMRAALDRLIGKLEVEEAERTQVYVESTPAVTVTKSTPASSPASTSREPASTRSSKKAKPVIIEADFEDEDDDIE